MSVVIKDPQSEWIGEPPESCIELNELDYDIHMYSLVPPRDEDIDRDALNVYFDFNEPACLVPIMEEYFDSWDE